MAANATIRRSEAKYIFLVNLQWWEKQVQYCEYSAFSICKKSQASFHVNDIWLINKKNTVFFSVASAAEYFTAKYFVLWHIPDPKQSSVAGNDSSGESLSSCIVAVPSSEASRCSVEVAPTAGYLYQCSRGHTSLSFIMPSWSSHISIADQ